MVQAGLGAGSKVRKATRGLAAALALLAFMLGYYTTLYVFYSLGALNDTYLFAGLIWHNTPLDLQMPPNYGEGTFNVHIQPFLALWAAASYLFGFERIDWFALFMGCMQAGLTLAMMLPFLKADIPAPRWRLFAVGVAGTASILTPLLVYSLPLPHYEYWIMVFLLPFAWLLANRQYKLATAAFVICISVREDAAIHLSLVLGATAAALWLETRSLKRLWQDYRALCLFLPAAMAAAAGMMVQEWLTDSANHFSMLYVGHPPYAHLTWQEMADRLHFFRTERAYIWLPMLLTFIWALFARMPLLVAGALAQLPWLAVHLTAVTLNPSHLYWYYGFPFFTVLVWPVVAYRLKGLPLTGWRTFLCSLVVLASLANITSPSLSGYLSTYRITPPDPVWRAQVPRLAEAIKADEKALGLMVADQAVLGMFDQNFSYKNFIWVVRNTVFADTSQPISLFYYHNAYNQLDVNNATTILAFTQKQVNCYSFTGTPVRLVTTVLIDQLEHLRTFDPSPATCPRGELTDEIQSLKNRGNEL